MELEAASPGQIRSSSLTIHINKGTHISTPISWRGMRKPIKLTATFSEAEKASVTAACERLIGEFLRPRFLPVIRPTDFNYPVDILGKWRGANCRFIQRYRSGFLDNLGEEFDALFARLDWLSRDRFHWHRTPENGSACIAASLSSMP